MKALSKQKRFPVVIFKWILPILLVLVLLLFLCPLPFRKEFKCIEIKLDDPSYQRECTVRFDGKYRLNMFTDDSFEGKLQIDIYPETSREATRIQINKKYGNSLRWNRTTQSGNEVYDLGLLHGSRLLGRFAICVLDKQAEGTAAEWKEGGNWGSWSTTSGYCIVPNCSNYEDAVRYLSKMGIIPGN